MVLAWGSSGKARFIGLGLHSYSSLCIFTLAECSLPMEEAEGKGDCIGNAINRRRVVNGVCFARHASAEGVESVRQGFAKSAGC